MDPMGGGEDGIARIKDIGWVHVPTGTGIRKEVVMCCFGRQSLVMS